MRTNNANLLSADRSGVGSKDNKEKECSDI
jgi:hypothetical protein